MRLLLVEDDPNLGKATAEGLGDVYDVDWARSAEKAADNLCTVTYDLLVLDINLPGKSGLTLLSRLRKEKQPIPVLLLTARDTVQHKIEGLQAGADDYLVKPFDLGELLARCAALIRRSQGYPGSVIVYQDLKYEPHTGYLEKAGLSITLSAREHAIFDRLIHNIGRILSKEKLMEYVYGFFSDDIESNTIEVHIAALRRKLGKDIIRTIRGVGYSIPK